MMTSFRNRLVLLALISTLSGCAVHHINYNATPTVPSLPHYSEQISDEKMSDQPWWESFNRPALNNLTELALRSNQTVTQVLARVKQAQAITIQTRSNIFPIVNLEGDIVDSRQDGEDHESSSEFGGALQWEIDVFNRIGSAVEADRLLEIARIEDVNAVRLSLSAEVANAYFGAVAAQNRLNLLKEQVRIDKELLSLLELRMENGIGTNVEVLQQKSRVADSISLIPPAEADLRVFENRLDVLLGQMPDAINRVAADETLEFSEGLPFVGVPADLLLNRPDLRGAKAELIAADADIAAAIAERLPRITLDGSLVYADTAMFNGPVSMVMGTFIQPLLDWGGRKAEVERNKALYQVKLAAFTQSYLEAVESVENALYQEQQQRRFIRRLEQRRHILQATMEETEARYTQGVDDYLPVLSALQELRNVERDLITQRFVLVDTRIELHRAVGGDITTSTQK